MLVRTLQQQQQRSEQHNRRWQERRIPAEQGGEEPEYSIPFHGLKKGNVSTIRAYKCTVDG